MATDNAIGAVGQLIDHPQLLRRAGKGGQSLDLAVCRRQSAFGTGQSAVSRARSGRDSRTCLRRFAARAQLVAYY